ncbi:MAG TPA: hypothetical protein PKD12_13960 [Nitrospira sp.]|nr:hypothetical protein [Nitrospira sp.]
MSWTYWGIVIGLSALIVMLIACIRLLSFDRNEENRQRLKQEIGGSVDKNSEPPTVHRRVA